MAFQVSPGVAVKEIDLTNVIPAVSTSIGGYAGRYRWGPVEQVTLISSENELANQFGKPNDQYARSFFESAAFLQYGDALKVVRAEEDNLLNASSGLPVGAISGITVANAVDYQAATSPNEIITTVEAVGTGTGAILGAPTYKVSYNVVGSGLDGEPDGINYSVGDVVSLNIAGNDITFTVTEIDNDDGENGNVKRFVMDEPDTIFQASDLAALAQFDELPTTVVSYSGIEPSGAAIQLAFEPVTIPVISGGSGYDETTTLELNGVPASVYEPAPPITINIQETSFDNELIKNDEDFENSKSGLEDDIYSRYAGAIGNKTRVYILNNTNFAGSFTGATGTYDVAGNFDSAPDANTELHILVTTTAKEFTGDNSESSEMVVETWPFLGVASTSKSSDGSNNYYVDVINSRSSWIYIPNAIAGEKDLTAEEATYEFSGGVDGSTVRNDGLVSTALSLLADSETEDVNLLFTETDSNENTHTLANLVLSVATDRKDCVAFVSPPVSSTKGQSASNALTSVNGYKNTLSAPDSYGVIGSTSLTVYDKYNDKFIHIGSQGHLAGLCANTDNVADAWFSPAGFNRGQLRNVAKVDFNPNKAQRDSLYKNGINPIVAFPGQGIVLFGDKTLQSKPSAFDRINVRRLFIVLEKAIATAAKYQLFELNDEFTRAVFRNAVEPFLRDVQGRRGIYDFAVVCDETNNTGQVIDSNRFVADIYIKPARSINFITLNFIATRTGVDFSEVVGLTNA